MKIKLLFTVVSTVSLMTSMSASANDEGWYLRGNAGYGVHTDIDITGDMVGDVESEGNAAFSLGIGYEFANNWRLELDGDSLWTDLGAIGEQPSSFANLRTNTLMLNAIYDFEDFGRWAPYVGAGIGAVRGDVKLVAHDFLNPSPTIARNPACPGARTIFQAESCDIDQRDSHLGWQLLVGLGYDITDKLTWDTHYTYLDGGNLRVNGTRTNGVTNSVAPIAANLESVGAHSLVTGFRYRFGEKATPPPPPPPAPVADYQCWDGSMVFNAGQCPARPVQMQTCWDGSSIPATDTCPAQPQTYTCWDGSLVYDLATCPAQISDRGNNVTELCSEQYRQEIIYYEFDRGQSAETRNTINRILDIGQYCNVDNIRVVGHTDTSGSAAYNLNLSRRRAKDARDELVRQGVDGARITSEGKGETEPFVQTGDGVKEQLNRRTEVLISLGSVGVIN